MPRRKLNEVDCKYGAPMGRRDILPDDCTVPCKLHLVRLRWFDGDYDQGGAYWGRVIGGSDVYWAYGDAAEVDAQVFVWAKDREDAKAVVREKLPNARFYR